MTTSFTERNYLDDWLKQESENFYSRSTVTLTGSAALKSGTILGKILTAGATVVADGGNTGAGSLTVDVTDPVLSGAPSGDYDVTCVVAGSSGGGTFRVKSPDGVVLGEVIADGDAFVNHIKFAIASSGADFALGDKFTVTAADGSSKFTQLDLTATTGAEIAAGILVKDADPTDADVDGVVLLRHAVVMAGNLIYPEDITEGETEIALANLTAIGIISDRVEA